MRFLVLLVLAAGCGEDRECTYDVDCPIGRRCVATQCVGLQIGPGLDASVGRDSGIADSGPLPDAAPDLDAAPDATVELECTLSMQPPGGIVVASAADGSEGPQLTRAGLGLFGVAVRTAFGLSAQYINEDGEVLVGPFAPLNDQPAQPDFALAASRVGDLAVVWLESDDRVHGSMISELGDRNLGLLTEVVATVSAPTIARTADGFVIAWAGRDSGIDRLSTRALDDSGVPQGEAVAFDTPDAARLPALADSEVSDLALAWSDARSGSTQPYAGTRRPDGSIAGETELSGAQLAGSVDAVMTPLGLFVSWIESPQQPGGMGSVHVSRLEGADLTDRTIASVTTLDGRTSITWDGDRALVGWHRGAAETSEASIAAVRPDLTRADDLALGAGTARPVLSADDTSKGLAWIETTTSDVRFAVLSCE